VSTSDSVARNENGLEVQQKPQRAWNERVSQFLSLVAIAWLGFVLLELAVLYHYAWQKGLYPKPGAPSHATCGVWCYDSFLEAGVRELLNAPVNAFIFALLAFIFRMNLRSGITLILSVVFTFIAFGHGFLVAD
jgi:hypothetical protein